MINEDRQTLETIAVLGRRRRLRKSQCSCAVSSTHLQGLPRQRRFRVVYLFSLQPTSVCSIHSMSMAAEMPFKISVSETDIELLRKKLEQVRFPDELEDAGWKYGTPLTFNASLDAGKWFRLA